MQAPSSLAVIQVNYSNVGDSCTVQIPDFSL